MQPCLCLYKMLKIEKFKQFSGASHFVLDLVIFGLNKGLFCKKKRYFETHGVCTGYVMKYGTGESAFFMFLILFDSII